MGDSSSEFQAIAPQFVVPDVVRTAEWYRDNLGFELLGYFWNRQFMRSSAEVK